MENRAWRAFERGKWCSDVDVRDFIQRNYTPYEGDGAFLAPATEATKQLWAQVMELTKEERARGGVYDATNSAPASGKFSPSTARRITTACSTRTRPKCALPVTRIS